MLHNKRIPGKTRYKSEAACAPMGNKRISWKRERP